MAHDDRNRRDGRWGPPTSWGGDEDAFGGGWGNQTPHAQRLGDRGHHGPSDDPDEGERYGGAAPGGYGASEFGPGTSNPDAFFGAPGYDPGFSGPRFDRVDVGSVGTHGVHPVASAFGGGDQGGTGAYGGGGFSSSARRRALLRQSQEQQNDDRGPGDPHYSEWRSRQIEQLDRDYEEYCRDRQQRFDQEFGSWRERRSRQREALGRVRERMEVVGADGEHVGTVDRVSGDQIVLTKSDAAAGGVHHRIPCSWVEEVGDRVRLNIDSEQAMSRWREEESSRALFERPEQGQSGPGILNRAFSGTYRDRDD